MTLPIEFYKELYKHHVSLYQKRRFTSQSGLFNKKLASMYANKLISDNLLTKEQFEMDLLPIVDIADLLGLKGSLAADGIE